MYHQSYQFVPNLEEKINTGNTTVLLEIIMENDRTLVIVEFCDDLNECIKVMSLCYRY